MFTKNHYVPIVRWKRGERKALEFLDESLKNQITPLIEIPPIEWDFEKEEPKKTIDSHLSGVASQVKEALSSGRIFLDLYHVCTEDDEVMENGQHPLDYLVSEFHEVGIDVVPVISNRHGESYKKAVKTTVNKFQNGVCLRLKEQDIDIIDTTVIWIEDYLNMNISNTDLVLDYEYINPEHESRMERLISGSIMSIPRLQEWRTFTICGTSMPESLGEISTGTDGKIRRSEWHIYKKIMGMNLGRKPNFGDYIISNPEYTEINPKFIQMAASIRYTSNDEFLIFRGYSIRSPRHNGWGQALELTNRIISSPYFSGKDFSYGDEYIYNCANQSVSTGSAEIWRRVGTNHHLTLVIKELATLHGASTVHLS